MSNAKTLPLDGIRVLDLTHRLAGPTLTMILGDWGADVIKLEWWHRMDAWRGMIDINHDTDGQQSYNKRPQWLKLNRNKRGIAVNLKTDRGKDLIRELVKKVDVVVENFSAGVMDRLGLGYEDLSKLNEGITMISMPGFGNHGPHAKFVGNANTVEGYGGLVSLTGYENDMPRNSAGLWPDPVAGITGTIAVLAAIHQREETGKGQYIELAQVEAVINLIGESILDYSVNDHVALPRGNEDSSMAPHGCYPCRGENAWITIAVSTDAEWEALCDVAFSTEWTDDTRFVHQLSRWKHRRELDELIAAWTQEEDRWELMHRLQEAGVPATCVITRADFESIEGFPSESFYQETEHPHLRRYPGGVGKLNREDLPIRLPPPMLGEHTDDVLKELLGLSLEELNDLRKDGVL